MTKDTTAGGGEAFEKAASDIGADPELIMAFSLIEQDARALLESANLLADAVTGEQLTEALDHNLRMWVAIKTMVADPANALPEEINEIIVVIGYQGDMIKSYLGANYKNKKVYYVLQEELSGTGNAVLLTKSYFKPDERFLIFYGDEFFYKDDVQNCLAHNLSWLCWEFTNPSAGNTITMSNGLVTEVVEKPKNPNSKIGGGGLMLVNTDLFNYAPEKHETGEYYLTSMMNKFIKEHEVHAVIGKNRPSFSSPEDIVSYGK